MGLTNVLNSAGSGLRVTQAHLDVVARNIANAETPGYTRKSHDQENLIEGDRSLGVHTLGVTRSIDRYLQNQLRVQSSAAANVDIRDQYLSRLDRAFGVPGEANALDTLFNEFSQSLQQLTTSPEAFETRQAAVGAAQVLSQRLRSLSGEVQGLRQLAEDQLAEAVDDINDTLQQLEQINLSLSRQAGRGGPPADLLDERDRFIDRLAANLEIRVNEEPDGRVRIHSASGNTLLDDRAVSLQFDHRGNVNANTLYSADPDERGVGTITLQGAGGYKLDLVEVGVFPTGRLGGLLELRDDLLTTAQDQLDELAGGLAQALSNRVEEGTAVTSGAAQGFDLDLTGLQPGNSISLRYTEGGVDRNVTIIRVDDATQLPLSDDVTPEANDTVIGVDFSAGVAAAAATIDAALGAAVSVTSGGGNLLRILDDGATATSDITAVNAEITTTALQDDGLQIALFVDGGNPPVPYSNSLEAGTQKRGFAARIDVNSQIASNNELLVRHSADTPLGDPDRPLEIVDRLNSKNIAFSPASGIGSSQAPFKGTVLSFARQVVSFQTGQAASVSREQASQDVIVTALRDKYQTETGVDIDNELAQLIQLQNAFAANARVIQIASEMMQQLMRAV